jgi:ribosomal protein S18 acetylase RimI-like enzyme
MSADIVIEQAARDFGKWDELLQILHAAFDYQKDRIDPPSSLYGLDEAALALKAQAELLLLARRGSEIAGCVFVRLSPGSTYLGKLAVRPDLQGRGIGRQLVAAVERAALEASSSALELETRIELVENHETFGRLGFKKVSEGSHDGYDRSTFITMRKLIGIRRP